MDRMREKSEVELTVFLHAFACCPTCLKQVCARLSEDSSSAQDSRVRRAQTHCRVCRGIRRASRDWRPLSHTRRRAFAGPTRFRCSAGRPVRACYEGRVSTLIDRPHTPRQQMAATGRTAIRGKSASVRRHLRRDVPVQGEGLETCGASVLFSTPLPARMKRPQRIALRPFIRLFALTSSRTR